VTKGSTDTNLRSRKQQVHFDRSRKTISRQPSVALHTNVQNKAIHLHSSWNTFCLDHLTPFFHGSIKQMFSSLMKAEVCHRSKVACCVLLKRNTLIVLPPLVHVSASENTQLCELSWNDFYIHVCSPNDYSSQTHSFMKRSDKSVTMQMPGGTQKQTLNRAVIIPGVQTALYPEQLEINK